MEDELKKLPLRSVSDNYSERVMNHIARAEAHGANVWIGAQIAVTGLIALLIAWAQSAEVIAVGDAVMENLSGVLIALDQFVGEMSNAFFNFRIEPLEGVAPLEWATICVVAGIVWLLANGWLIVNLKKEKLA